MRRIAIVPVVLALTVGAGETQAADEQEAAGTFGPAGSLAESRFTHSATTLPDGRVLVVGGSGDGFLASAEIWDPATATFGPAGSLADIRMWHTATALPDGRVLVVGGRGNDSATAEIWKGSNS